MSAFQVAFRNPDGLFTSRAFSQVAIVTGKAKTIYIGGQNAVDADGRLVGRDDLAAQTRQVLKNIETILVSEGATFQDLVKLNVYLLPGCDARVGFEAFQAMVGPMAHMPLVTVLFVAGLGPSAALVEIDGIAVVADEG